MHTLYIEAKKISKQGKARFRFKDGNEGFAEEIAMQGMNLRGWECIWSENNFWWTLMTILFWDVVFARLEGVYHPELGEFPSQHQDMPNDLFYRNFYSRRKTLIKDRFEELSKTNLKTEFTEEFKKHYGKPCRPIENWDSYKLKDFVNVLESVPKTVIFFILKKLLKNFNENRRGLPDLLLWRDDQIAFGEVKSKGDSLTPAQQKWLRRFEEFGVDTYLIRVGEFQGENTFDDQKIVNEGNMKPSDLESEKEPKKGGKMKEPVFGSSINIQVKSWDEEDEAQGAQVLDDISEIFQDFVKGSSEHENIQEELLLRLFPYDIVWPAFDEWHDYFEQIGYFPRMWNGLEYQKPTMSKKGLDYLDHFARLSLSARKLLVTSGFFKATKQQTIPLYDLKRKSDLIPEEFGYALDELKGNFLKQEIGIRDRLLLLRIKDLKPILEELGLKKSGRKNELAERLANNASEGELEKYLTPEAKAELIVSKRWLPSSDNEAVSYQVRKIKLIGHTLMSTRSTQQSIDNCLGIEASQLEIMITGNCPICLSKGGKVELSENNLSELPPFHPGCRCYSHPLIPEKYRVLKHLQI